MIAATTEPTITPKPKRQTKRRGNGEGSIYLRWDNRWCGCVTVGINAAGKRIRREVYGATKREVQEKLTGLQSSKLDGTLCDSGKITLAAFLERWLADVAKPGVRETTLVSYQGIVTNHINPLLGGVALAKITPVHVQGLYSMMADDKKSARLRQLTHAVLRRSLKQAVRWGLVPRNVCEAVDPPRVPKVEIRPLSPEQVDVMLLTAEGNRLEALYVVAVTTGMRMGELFGLQWADVDLANKSLAVRWTLSEVGGRLTLGEPKTKASRRKIELSDGESHALHEHRKRMIAAGHAGVSYVFCNQHGGPLRRSHFHKQDYKPLLKLAGLPAIKFHDLRHTAATLMLAAGVHPKVVQERLGHSQIGITMDTYSHCLPTMQRSAVGLVSDMLAGFKAARENQSLAKAAGA